MPYSLQRPLRRVYGALPPSLAYGGTFWKTYDFLRESQYWSREKLEEYQLERLGGLLHHAYDNVPYYRRIFDERGMKPGDIQSLQDLRRLPCLTKDKFRESFAALVATNSNAAGLPMAHTSGTSGKHLAIYRDCAAVQQELACVFHQWSRVGFMPGDRRVEIRGIMIRSRKRYEYDRAFRALRLSPLIEDVDTAGYYLRLIGDFRADFLHGYPSAIAQLAEFVRQYGLAVPFRLKAVLLASEVVYGWQRKIVEDVFSCRVCGLYGMAEQVTMAGECESSSHYHCLPQYGITEVDAESGEIVGTGFLNYVSPLIRYRTDDIASDIVAERDCCGREYYPVFRQVEGRVGDYIATSRGLFGPATITHYFKKLNHVRETQLIQSDLDRIVVRVVPRGGAGDGARAEELERLRRDLLENLGPHLHVEIEEVDELERTASGKFKWIVSDVSGDILEERFSVGAPAAGPSMVNRAGPGVRDLI
jgi:phenylacetate-CoA ligase